MSDQKSCIIFFMRNGIVYEAKQTVLDMGLEYSGLYGYSKCLTRPSEISDIKITRRPDILRRFKSKTSRLTSRRQGSWY